MSVTTSIRARALLCLLCTGLVMFIAGLFILATRLAFTLTPGMAGI